MTEKEHKSRWGLVVALGVFAIAVGAFINAYAIIVVQSGPFPVTSGGYQITGFFFIGIGMGYLICTPMIKELEKKARKLEGMLHEQKTTQQNELSHDS
jgi:hypothetical protein